MSSKCELELRVLVLASSRKDARLTQELLSSHNIPSMNCGSVDELQAEIQKGAGAIILAKEQLNKGSIFALAQTINSLPSWSHLPIVMLTSEGDISQSDTSALKVLRPLGNVTLLERPVRIPTLISIISASLADRKRQYETRDTLEELAKSVKSRDQFLATLSHELRTPLNVILGWVGMLRNERLDENTFDQALETLERNAQVQKALIEDLLDVSRIITGKLSVDCRPIELGTIVENTVMGFQLRAREKSLHLQLDVGCRSCPISGDPTRISQILTNLLQNAIKFTPAHGYIQVRLTANDDVVKIEIQDTGQGIEPDFIIDIFEPLKQEEMGTTRAHGGLGLGLAITRHLVERHDGEIEVRSDGRGKGATFTVTFPRLFSDNAELPTAQFQKSEPQAANRDLNGLKVLVVDDSPDVVSLLTLWLRRKGAVVHAAGNAREGLEKVRLVKPDVLLSDIGMPGEDGYALLSKVRSLSPDEGGLVPAAALTAYARDEERARALKAGFQMHISKPVSDAGLIEAVAILAESPI